MHIEYLIIIIIFLNIHYRIISKYNTCIIYVIKLLAYNNVYIYIV